MIKNSTKRILAVVLALVMAVSLFTVAASAAVVDINDDSAVSVSAPDSGDTGDNPVGDVTVPADDDIAEVGDLPTEEAEGTTVADPTEIVDETQPETTAEETVASTEAATTAATTAETQAPTSAKDIKSPKTGDSNTWLWIGIGICALAVIIIIITVVVKKKKDE